MNNKLTWNDVSHYYAKLKPMVLLAGDTMKIPKICHESYYTNRSLEGDLPVLKDISTITEKQVRHAISLIEEPKLRRLAELGIEDSDIFPNAFTKLAISLYSNPAVFHYLISEGFNVFGIPTYDYEKAITHNSDRNCICNSDDSLQSS